MSAPQADRQGVRGLVEAVERRSDEVARRMLARIEAEVPIYGHLPREQLDGEILGICRRNVEFFLASIARGGQPDPGALAALNASAARRAEERVPLDAVLAAYHVGSGVAWEVMREQASPEEHPEQQQALLDVATSLMTYIQAVTSAVSDAYVEERGTIAGDEREARRATLDALIGSHRPAGLGSSLPQALAEVYVPVALVFGPSSDEVDADVEAAVAARRKLRRCEEYLVDSGPEGVLFRLESRGGLALLPAADGTVNVSALVEGLAKAADAGVVAGVGPRVAAADTGPAMAEAREVARLAVETGRAAGTYELDDLILEFLCSRPGRARERLDELVERLGDGPDLEPTLRAWFAADFDRRKAAGELHVHPNTLDYRLRRVAELTGLDPGSARGVQLLGAALLARTVTEPPPSR